MAFVIGCDGLSRRKGSADEDVTCKKVETLGKRRAAPA
jgi:hypothetical protein